MGGCFFLLLWDRFNSKHDKVDKTARIRGYASTPTRKQTHSKSKRGQNGIISSLTCSPDANSGLYAAGSFAGSIGLYDLRAGAGAGGGKRQSGGWGDGGLIVEHHSLVWWMVNGSDDRFD